MRYLSVAKGNIELDQMEPRSDQRSFSPDPIGGIRKDTPPVWRQVDPSVAMGFSLTECMTLAPPIHYIRRKNPLSAV